MEGKWKWKIDGSGRGIKVYSVREIKVAAANCKKTVQSCMWKIINLAVKGVFPDISHLPDKVKKIRFCA